MTWQSFVILSFLFSLFSCQHLSQVPVKLDVYYESLSSDSIKFITTQLYPSWKHFGTDLLNVKFHPYGNSNFTSSGHGWNFSCEHGQEECKGNMVQACILNQVGNPEEYVPLIHCIMSAKHPDTAAKWCLSSLSVHSTSYQRVIQCTGSVEGETLLHNQGVVTSHLDPPHDHLPWLIFNDIFSEKQLVQGFNNLTWVICCKHLHGGDKCNGYPQYCV